MLLGKKAKHDLKTWKKNIDFPHGGDVILDDTKSLFSGKKKKINKFPNQADVVSTIQPGVVIDSHT